ncbi:MAG TPA: hypothetical protein VG738_15965 [Chitinophagaceae bacterium]|nr:hypothetical protein [Chitinophagaceae bacterium]
MPRIWLLSIAFMGLLSCKTKMQDLSGEGPVSFKDFNEAFKPLSLSLTIADSNILRLTDSTIISKAVFTQFIPDSAFEKFVNSPVTDIQINPVGSIQKSDEEYLLASIKQKKKIILVAFVLDKKKKYEAALQLFANNYDDGYTHSVNINREPTFIISREKNSEGNTSLLYTRNGYAYSSSTGTFMKVVDDSNEGKPKNAAIINPIDTLPRKNKYSADYVGDKKNFISVRDGKNAGNYNFFMHFEKNDGDCIGELKGEMTMHGSNKALYQQSGDPCEIDFTFEDNGVIVKERGNCGNHRGIKCYFDDEWPKQKVKKPKKSSG